MAAGQYSGLNYEIPLNQSGGTPQPQGYDVQPPEIGSPQASKNPLAVRQGKTREVYNAYNTLKSFGADMAKRGVDITAPDWSQPDGGLPYQTYLQLDAIIRTTTDELAQEQQAQEQFMKARLENKARLAQGVNMNTANLAQDPNQIVSLQPTYAEEEANRRAAQPTNTQAASNAVNKATVDKQAANIDAQIAAGTISAEQGAAQKDMLFRNAPDPPIFAPRADGGDKKKGPNYVTLFKNISQFAKGVWNPTNTKPIIYRGKSYTENPQYTGTVVGTVTKDNGNGGFTTIPKVIKRALKDKNGDVYLEYTDPALDLERVDHLPKDAIFKRFMENDNVYGGSAGLPAAYDQLMEAGIIDSDTYAANPAQIFSANSDQIAATTKAPERKNLGPAVDKLQKQFDRLSAGEITLNVPGTDGKTYQFDYDSNKGVFLKNYKELGIPRDQYKGMSFDDLLKFYDEKKIWKSGGGQKAPAKQVSPAEAERLKRIEAVKAKAIK
jgi:hypothetical protein